MLSVFSQVPATLVRPTGTIVAGRWVPDVVAPVAITVITPQRASGTDLQMLPDGDRQYVHLKTWSTTELHADDLLTVGGVEHRVVLVEDWEYDGNFHKALIRKVQS
ncbi:MAG TPA: hypothetical protein VJ553_00860 [Candidatus Paceibacterota bacterium]|nr:hypothetical protein [Candidatus Paceibacterota bacterium]